MTTINSGWTMALVALGLAGSVLGGCSSEPTPGPSAVDAGALTPSTRGTGMTVTLMVGPEGGTLTLESVSITVPPGALTSTRTLSVTSSMEAAPTDDVAYSPVYRFEPEGLTFAQPVAVRIAVAADAADPTLAWTLVGSNEFEELDGVVEGGVLRGSVTHFSRGFARRRRARDGGVRDAGGDVTATDVAPADVPAGFDGGASDVPVGTDAPTDDVVCNVAGTRYCGAAAGCVPIYGNDLHCGGCGNVCMPGEYCTFADCVRRPADAGAPDARADGGGACPAPSSACGLDCVFPATDRNNCGTCGNVCPVAGAGMSSFCSAGVCGVRLNCGELTRDCDGNTANGCETPVNVANCRACGVACAAGQTCNFGNCIGGDAGSLDVGPTDVGVDVRIDVGPADAGTIDAGPVDAGATDVRPADVGSDVGTVDVRPADTGAVDAGTADTGPTDTGPTDTGPTDTGPADVGCAAGLTTCGGACVNLTSDRDHCGTCATACPTGQGCYAGVCATCGGATPNNCSGTCVDVRNDVNHCSACGVACLPRGPNEMSQCEASVCSRMCRSFFAECDGNGATICETNVGTDNANCGSCGTACAAGLTCITGGCRCPAGTTLCGGACVNTATNRSHCGGCGVTCTASQACTAGVCAAVTCTSPEVSCSGACANVAIDPSNCGTCGTTCTSTQYCNMRACVACAAGRVRCTNMPGYPCIDPQTDRSNCGACGTACAAAYAGGEGFCAAGACGTRCAAFQGNCDGSLTNGCETSLMNDRNNCGACGNVCPAGQRCQEQNCVP